MFSENKNSCISATVFGEGPSGNTFAKSIDNDFLPTYGWFCIHSHIFQMQDRLREIKKPRYIMIGT